MPRNHDLQAPQDSSGAEVRQDAQANSPHDQTVTKVLAILYEREGLDAGQADLQSDGDLGRFVDEN